MLRAVRLGQLLISEGLVLASDVEQALRQQRRARRRLGSLLIEAGAVEPDAVARALARQFGVPACLSKHWASMDHAIAYIVPSELARRLCAYPIARTKQGGLVFVMRNPRDAEGLTALGRATRATIVPSVAPETLIWAQINHAYPLTDDDSLDISFDTGAHKPVGGPDDDDLSGMSLGAITLVDLDHSAVEKQAHGPISNTSWQDAARAANPVAATAPAPALPRTQTGQAMPGPSLPRTQTGQAMPVSALPPRATPPAPAPAELPVRRRATTRGPAIETPLEVAARQASESHAPYAPLTPPASPPAPAAPPPTPAVTTTTAAASAAAAIARAALVADTATALATGLDAGWDDVATPPPAAAPKAAPLAAGSAPTVQPPQPPRAPVIAAPVPVPPLAPAPVPVPAPAPVPTLDDEALAIATRDAVQQLSAADDRDDVGEVLLGLSARTFAASALVRIRGATGLIQGFRGDAVAHALEFDLRGTPLEAVAARGLASVMPAIPAGPLRELLPQDPAYAQPIFVGGRLVAIWLGCGPIAPAAVAAVANAAVAAGEAYARVIRARK